MITADVTLMPSTSQKVWSRPPIQVSFELVLGLQEAQHGIMCIVSTHSCIFSFIILHIHAIIQVEFQVPMFTSSGVHVRFLRVYDKSGYQTNRWVRYITR